MKHEPLEKIIVFGASGFIGGAIVRHFTKLTRAQVVGLSSSDCDLTDRAQAVAALSGCGLATGIVFCSGIGRSTDNSYESYLKNISMARNVKATLSGGNVPGKLIFLSSCDVYGHPPDELPITERTIVKPLDYYSSSKVVSEMIFLSDKDFDCSVTVLRLPGIYGHDDGHNSVVGGFVRKIARDERITLSRRGYALRDYVYVDDLCRIVEFASAEPHEGVLNVATGRSVAIKDIAMMAGDKMGKKPNITLSEKSGERDCDLVFDNSKLAALCPDLAFTDLAHGIEKYLENSKP